MFFAEIDKDETCRQTRHFFNKTLGGIKKPTLNIKLNILKQVSIKQPSLISSKIADKQF